MVESEGGVVRRGGRSAHDGTLFPSHCWIRSTAATSSTGHSSTRCSSPWPLPSSPNWTAANRSATSLLSRSNSFYFSSWSLTSWTFSTHLFCLSRWWTCLVSVHRTRKFFFDFHQLLYNFLTNFIINNVLWRFLIYSSLDFLSQSTEEWTYLLFSQLIFCFVKCCCKTFHQIIIISTIDINWFPFLSLYIKHLPCVKLFNQPGPCVIIKFIIIPLQLFKRKRKSKRRTARRKTRKTRTPVETIESPYKGVTRNKSGNGFRGNASITKKNPTRRVQANAKAETALLCAKHLNFRCREKNIPIPNPEIGFEDPALTKKGRRPRKRVLSDVKIETDVKVEIVDCLNRFCWFQLHP